MSGGAEVRVHLQEAGQESPRMPAWKREILERRKAKGGGSGGAGAAETSPVGAGPQRVNGELTGTVNGSSGTSVPKSDSGATGGSGRNYTITTASQHFTNNKEEPRPTSREDVRAESLVLQESLGPLEENPFIKLEKERRRRQDRENAARPVQHILELYGSVPGIRTIRADNIIIIESDPDYFPEAGGLNSGSNWQQNGVSSYSSLNDLLDRRGSAVTEIRAKEVVIYDTTLSKSEENLSTLGRPDHEVPSYETGEGQGRVSRMLQKFDSNYGKLQKKSHSTENLLDLDCSAGSSRPRLWSKPQPDLVPKPRPGPSFSSQPSSPVFQSPWSSKPKQQPSVSEPPQSVSSVRQRFAESGGPGAADARDEPDRWQAKPGREKDLENVEVPPKPKVPCSAETPRAHADPHSHSTRSMSSKVSHSSTDFEIRPSPKPDLEQIPDGDAQARALANLRLQSRNSFMVIPKRRPTTSPTSGGPVKSLPSSHRAAEVPAPAVPTSNNAPTKPTVVPSQSSEEKEKEVERRAKPSKPEPSSPVATSPALPPASERLPPPSPSPAPSSPPAALSSPISVPATPLFSPLPSTDPLPVLSNPSPVSSAPLKPPGDHLPVTNIDDIEVDSSSSQHASPVAPSPAAQRRKGNTFTVVPKRRTEPEAAQPGSPEPPQEASGGTLAPPGSTPPQAPYSQLGSLLKKRYPAVEEIEVIGGYLSLDKSCLSQTGSVGKKLTISFNEASLRSTYEYPSESSVWDSGEEDETDENKAVDKVDKVGDEQPSMVGRIHIPRAGFPSSHANNGNDLSSYVPKHAVDFSAWQEHKLEDAVHQEDTTSQSTQVTEEVMLTPADSSSLSDYSSEPALYF